RRPRQAELPVQRQLQDSGAGPNVRREVGAAISKGRKPLTGFCTSYHCSGDCGMHGFGYQHAVVDLAQQRRKRLTLAAFDQLQHEQDREREERRAEVERGAQAAMTAAKTTAERQRAYKARKADAGLTEVRGIYAPPERHAAIREAAA